jgi:NAD(P)-dependent dehydrogenase (short-subunit alcohol dehydrogenase family)
MDIKNSVALVTGANRGLGRHLAAELLSRGAKKVYAAARIPASVDLPGVVPLQLDITDPASVEAAAKAAPDATLLINNAGISTHTALVDGDLADIRLEMETNLFGVLGVTRAFAPVLTANGGGAILNVLSVLAWQHYPAYGAYSVAKAGAWAMTNVIRQELAAARIDVTALVVGYMDTDMADYVDPSNKADPAVVARLALDGVQARALEVIGDDKALNALAGLSGGADQMYPGFPVAL